MTPYEVARGTVLILEDVPTASGIVNMASAGTIRTGRIGGSIGEAIERRLPVVGRADLNAAEPLLVFPAGIRPSMTYGYNVWRFFAWEDPTTSPRPLEVLEALGPAVVEVAIELQAPGLDVVDVTQMAEAAMGVEPFDWRLP